MTAVGKILVFFNLVFSLAVGAFAILDYTARTHWADGFKKLEARVQMAEASNATYRAEAEKLQGERKQLNDILAKTVGKAAEIKGDGIEDVAKKVAAALDEAQNTIKNQKIEIDGLNGKVTAARQTATQQEVSASADKENAKRYQEDSDKLRGTLKDEMKKNYELVKEKNDLRDKKVAAEIQAATLMETNRDLESRYRETLRDLARIKSGIGGGTATARPGQNNPPPENVEGLVKFTDAASRLMTITLGSDAGLAKGNTMEVFRLSPTPRYLGKIKIVEVTANQAVAEPVGRMTAPVQAGDKVASRIMGNN